MNRSPSFLQSVAVSTRRPAENLERAVRCSARPAFVMFPDAWAVTFYKQASAPGSQPSFNLHLHNGLHLGIFSQDFWADYDLPQSLGAHGIVSQGGHSVSSLCLEILPFVCQTPLSQNSGYLCYACPLRNLHSLSYREERSAYCFTMFLIRPPRVFMRPAASWRHSSLFRKKLRRERV